MTCLDPDPERRYASAFDLESDLRRFIAGEPILARPSTLPYRLWRRVARQKTLSATVAASLLMLTSLLAWNIQTRAQTARQTELATRFGLEVNGLENLMRLEHLMPCHDLRPAENRLREGMARIQKEMETLGRPARGPGLYAVGRIELTLREDEAALKHLEQAWALGFHAPEAAYALGMALSRQFGRDLLAASRGKSFAVHSENRSRLMDTIGKRALGFFAQSRGQALEHPALGEAHLAYMQGQFETCRQKCQEAFAAVPWLVEAKELECEALESLYYALEEGGHYQERDRLHALGDAAIAEGMARAPSDERLLSLAINRQAGMATRESLEGHPTEATFKQGELLYDRALLLKPGDPSLVENLATLRMRHAVLLSSHGQDVRQSFKNTIGLVEAETSPKHRPGVVLAQLNWFLGASEWLWGDDPRPSLARARRLYEGPGAETSEVDLVEARFLLARGQDPRVPLQKALADLPTGSPPQASADHYLLQIEGEVRCLEAQWALAQGLDPLPAVRAGLRALERSEEHFSRNAYLCWDRALMEAILAERMNAQGLDPWPALARARKAALQGMARRGDHYRSVWTLVQIQLFEARRLKAKGGDAAPVLAEARKVLSRAFAAGQTCFLLRQVQAEVELMEGHPREAEAAALKGLEIKKDAIGLWLALAEAHRLQAASGSTEHRAGAREALRWAEALGPGWGPLRRMAATIPG